MTADSKKCLVIGYGSIGKRHEAVLLGMGAETAVVSQHASSLSCSVFTDVQQAVSEFNPHYIVVANRTSEHMQTLDKIEAANFKGCCLVEKPLAEKPVPFGKAYGFDIRVGYVMRFHPIVSEATKLLEGNALLSLHAYVGQYLPDWRPGTDYRECYSASKVQGGGALRDLSHELDYIQWITGGWKKVAALGGHVSDLEIETDDVFGLLMETERCPVVLCQMNYLDRNVRRDCTIQYEGGTLYLDFVGNQLVHNGVVQKFELERNEMFVAMHSAGWTSEIEQLCSFGEAAETLYLIEAAEESTKESQWVWKTSP